MGPSVKFVSAIKDAIFKKKMGVIFFFGKNAKPGGRSEGGLAKDHSFSGFSFVQPSLINALLSDNFFSDAGACYQVATKRPREDYPINLNEIHKMFNTQAHRELC